MSLILRQKPEQLLKEAAKEVNKASIATNIIRNKLATCNI